MRSRSTRALAVLASAGLMVGALVAGPADAAKKKKKAFSCKPAPATAPTDGHSSNAADAAKAKVYQVTAAATEAKPLTIEFEHGPALTGVQEDTHYFGFQVVSKTPETGLYIREEWGGFLSDIDLYLYDAAGTEVALSGAYNPAPIPGVTDSDGNGGMGFESIPGFPAAPCSPYTLESKGYATPGESVTLKVWLGPVTDTYSKP